jgi:hypothetical protein
MTVVGGQRSLPDSEHLGAAEIAGAKERDVHRLQPVDPRSGAQQPYTAGSEVSSLKVGIGCSE